MTCEPGLIMRPHPTPDPTAPFQNHPHPQQLPTLAPTNDCPPTRIKAKAMKKELKQGKKLGVYVKLNLLKQKDQNTTHEREKSTLGLLVTLPPNATLVGQSAEGGGGLKKKGLKGFWRVNETTLAWQPTKQGGRRKVSLVLRIRVDAAFPDPFLTVGLAGFTGDLCISSGTALTVPVVPSKRTSSSKPPKRNQLVKH